MRWSALVLAALAATGVGCRRFDVCGSAELPCERATGAENVGGAGAGGEGAQPTGDECTPTRASCDRSTLNGCETDLLSNPRHCGACEQECAGVCSAGSCVPFDVKVTDVYDAMANVLVTDRAAFFVARPSQITDAASLGRYDLATGDVTWVAEGGWSEVTALAASAQRLYVLGDYTLYSMLLGGDQLRDEGLAAVDAVSVVGTTVAASVNGDAYVRRGDEGEFALIPGEGYVSAIAATLGAVYVARDLPTGRGYAVEEYDLTYGMREVVATGPDYVRALQVLGDINSAYVATEAEYASKTWRLHGLDRSDAGAPLVEFPWDTRWVITPAPSPLGGRAWVGTYSEGSRKGIRMVTLWDQPFHAEWPTVGVVEALSSSGTELWFVDRLRYTLVSIDLEDMIRPTAAPPSH